MNFETESKNESSPPSLGGVAQSAGVVGGQAPSEPRETSNDVQAPPGWATASLGALTLPRETANPKAIGEAVFQYVDIDALDNRTNKITSPKQIKGSDAPSRARMAIRKGDVLFSLVRPYLKNIAIVPDELDKQIASTAYCVLRPGPSIESAFLFYQLLQDSFIHAVPTYGNSPPSARDDEFLEMHVRVAPTAEQTRIVAKLEELLSDLDAGLAALGRAQANLKRYRAAVLKAAVEGKLTEQWRKDHSDVEPASKLLERILAERRKKWQEAQLAKYAAAGKTPPKDWKDKYTEPTRPDVTALPGLPPRWCWAGLGQIAFFQNGRSFPSSEYSANGVKLLRPGSLFADGSVQWTEQNTKRMPEKWAERHPDYIVRGRNLIMNLTAQSLKDEFLGRVCITNSEEHCLLNQRLARINAIDGVQEMFLLYVLKSERFRRFVNELNTGSLIQHMFTSQLNDFVFPLPPFSEQSEIVQIIEERLSVAKHVEDTIDASTAHARILRQSILKRAFEGKLVPQDPNDEPASVLLERIRAARTASAPPTRNGRAKRIGAA